MGFDFLPAADNWEKACVAVKVKPDKVLSKALADSFSVNTDQPEKRLAMLPKIHKLASDFKKSKPVVEAGPPAAKLVGDLIDVIPKVKKKLEGDIQAFKKNCAVEVGVQIIVVDWNGKPFEYAKGFATFESPGVPTINATGTLSANGLKIDKVKLRPTGTVSLMVSTGSRTINGVTDYELKPGKNLMKFKAIQHFKSHKTMAKSVDEVKKKFGFKVNAGIEWKIVKVGGEKTNESEYNEAREEAVEWEIEEGMPTFKEFKQF
ncbi:MAG TPA: hypothetical protein VM509_04310 [Planctomycetota bacterium]|nr:hypothetical protein [Planctomycetota bacterium]